jgi:hypothetical protein
MNYSTARSRVPGIGLGIVGAICILCPSLIISDLRLSKRREGRVFCRVLDWHSSSRSRLPRGASRYLLSVPLLADLNHDCAVGGLEAPLEGPGQ